MLYTSAQLFCYVGVFPVDSLYGYVYQYTYQQEAIMSDQQFVALLAASPFLMLSAVWIAHDTYVVWKAGR